jgi:asparagine synthase (glutamine-hydrolysing)
MEKKVIRERKLLISEQKWTKWESLILKGTPMRDTEELDPKKLFHLMSGFLEDGVPDLSGLKKVLATLRGFYAAIWAAADYTILIADIVRTYPLYYWFFEEELFISDWLNVNGPRKGGGVSGEELFEFLMAGFVSGPRTIYKNIQALEAGEVVFIDHASGTVHRTRAQAFLPLHPDLPTDIQEGLIPHYLRRLQRALDESTERLIKFLDGRTALLPLSGGWDSRTIALQLKRHGYKRVLAFSYGVEGNRESATSREVARQLGFEWRFVPYSIEDWQKLRKDEAYWEYLRYAHSGVSLPHIQDVLAVKKLVDQGVVEPASFVAVPGHSGDFVAGSHVRLNSLRVRSSEKILDSLLEKHYGLLTPDVAVAFLRDLLTIESGVGCATPYTCLRRLNTKLRMEMMSHVVDGFFIDAASYLDFWNWKERQSKFIVNSVRVYEFWGLAHWLPLWDKTFCEFWMHVPLQLRYGRRLNGLFLAELQSSQGLVLKLGGEGRVRQLRRQILHFLDALGFKPTVENILQKLSYVRNKDVYNSHPLQWYGIWERGEFEKLRRQLGFNPTINSLVVLDVLELYRK